MKPVFAKGITEKHTVSRAIYSGDNDIDVMNADVYYQIGDEIFICESDGTEAEYLGQAVSVDSMTIVTTRSLIQDKSNLAVVWKPVDFLALNCAPSSPFDRKYVSGVEIIRTEGGVSYATKTADSHEELSLRFENYPRSGFLSIENWLVAECNYFLDTWYYVDESRGFFIVRALDEAIVQFEKQVKNVTFTLGLEIIDSGNCEL